MYYRDVDTEGANLNLTCLFVCPAFKCELWENLGLGLLFILTSILSCYYLFDNCRKTKKKCKIFDQTILYWLTLIIFLLFRGILSIAPINYNYKTVKLIFLGMHHILLFIPMCLVILILFDLLFTYQNPGTNAINFFRSLFLLFLATFVILGLALSLIDINDDDNTDPEMSLSLWVACTDLILMIFFVIPAWSLLKAVTYPMIQPEDRACVNFCRVGIFLNTFIFFLRMLFNFLHYIDQNPVQDWVVRMNREEAHYNGGKIYVPADGVRIYNFFYYLIFDFAPVVLSMIAVNLFKKHDLMFNENPYYTKQSD